MKAFEKELNQKDGDAAKFAVGMKPKPFEIIAALIEKATKGLGTNQLLLTSCIVRYQDLMRNIYIAREALFEKRTLSTKYLSHEFKISHSSKAIQ